MEYKRFGRKNALCEVRDFCLSNYIKVCMLCEVKLQSPPSLDCIRKCGFQYFDCIPTVGYSGGMWLIWTDCNMNPFSLSIVLKLVHFMARSTKLLNQNVSFVVIFAYALANSFGKS